MSSKLTILPDKMSYSQSKNTSDVSKRLRILRAQLYGKDTDMSIHLPKQSLIFSNSPASSYPQAGLDTSYIKRDLYKTFIIATLLVGVQVTVYLSLKNHLLKLPF